MNAADHDRLLGVTLEGRYQLLRLLGKGGMGRVYLAEERLLRRHCAVKLLPHEHTENATNVERFLREAQVIARVRHENIVEIYSFGQDPDGEVFYVMELLSGEDLEARLKDPARGLPDWHELCGWGVQICRALAAVHDAGFVHRDLKPGNLFLTRRSDGSALIKLLDFGIARPVESQLTGTGAFLGTMPYMSPEQVQALPLDGRSDIYAFGILLYRAIAGRPPFRGDPVQVIQQHVHAPPPALLPLAQGRSLPAALLDLIDRCLRKSREERFQSMREVEATLSALLAEQSPRLADSVAPAPPSPLADSAPPSPVADSTAHAFRSSLVDSPPPSASLPAEVSTNVYAAPRLAVVNADAVVSDSKSLHREPASSTDEYMSLPTLEPDDSLVDPHHRFRAPTPERLSPILPPAAPQHVAMRAPVVEEAPAPTLPTSAQDPQPSAQDPQPSASRRTVRRRLIMGLAAVSVLVLLFVLRPRPSEREPDPPTPRTSVSQPALPIPSVPARVVTSIPASTPTASPADPPADELPVEAAQPPNPTDDSLAETATLPPGVTPGDPPEAPLPPKLPPKVASTSSSKATTSPERPKVPRSLQRESSRCRRKHDALNLPPIVLDYSLINREVVGPRTITAVAPALAACLEAALLSTTFAGDELGFGKRISL